jgi:DNA-binding transcriptional LysR family regulator
VTALLSLFADSYFIRLILILQEEEKMELRHLRYFVAAAEELHFSRAAERLNISAPTLTQQIQVLEADLGVVLFRRTKRSVALTEAGRRFLEEARATLRQAEQAAQVARQAARGEIGRLEIGYVTSASCLGLIPSVLASFHRENPWVELRLHRMETVRQLNALTQGQIDLGFLRPPLRYPSGLTGATIWKQPFIIAMPQDHSLAGENRIRVALLADEPLIASSVELELGFGGQIHEIAAEGKFTPRVVNRAPDILTILCLVAAGMGCAFVPASFRRVAMPGIVYRELAGPERNALLAAARRKDNPAPAMKAFMRVLKATLERRDWATAH